MVKEKMENKYLNEAIIGNKNMIATFTSKGELQRLYFPSKDNKQYINFFHTGVKINNSDLIYLQNDINNVYKQYYDTDTNVLNTEITNTYFNLKIVQTDFIMIKENVLVKKYIFLNDGKIDLDTKFYIHSELLSDQNNQVGCKIVDGGMMQYAHDFSVSTFAKEHKLCSHQINGSKETIKRGEIQDKDYIGMSKDSSISYDLGIIKPQEKKILEICILIDENRNLSDMEDEIDRVTKIDLDKEYTSTKSYWRKYVKAHNSLGLKEAKNSYEERILEIYKRSILLFPLLANQETGGIIASPEIDENFTKCGRYAYCWPRDAVFITKAMDILNMEKETEKFYKVFCKRAVIAFKLILRDSECYRICIRAVRIIGFFCTETYICTGYHTVQQLGIGSNYYVFRAFGKCNFQRFAFRAVKSVVFCGCDIKTELNSVNIAVKLTAFFLGVYFFDTLCAIDMDIIGYHTTAVFILILIAAVILDGGINCIDLKSAVIIGFGAVLAYLDIIDL